MSDKYIEKKIISQFEKKGKKIKKNENFFHNNIIDSFDVIDLISFIEKEFDIKFKSTDYQNPNFPILKNLVKIIKKYRGRL